MRQNPVAWHGASHYVALQDLSSAKPRRTRFSDNKSHACDAPGCRKTFYERGNMLRHQHLKHGRMKRGYGDQMRSIIGVQRLPSHANVALPPPSVPGQQSNTISSPQGDVDPL